MGFTIEDMLTVSKTRYGMELMAGENGWSNSISWILLIEDVKILNNFKGKDLAITTGFGFQDEVAQLELAASLIKLGASGLIINTGMYITEIPDSMIRFCNENSFPLLTVPWSTELFEMIKDLDMRILLQGMSDEQISKALIGAIETPALTPQFKNELLPYFDVDGTFQVILITMDDLDSMDTVERRRISFQLQLYLESLTHNACFFYYDSCFVVVANAIPEEDLHHLIEGFIHRAEMRMKDRTLYAGGSSLMKDLSSLHLCYHRAKAALRASHQINQRIVWFDNMGLYRILALVPDDQLLEEMGEGLLMPLIQYDRKHHANYVEILEQYLLNNGSIQAVSKKMFMHRNTVIYKLGNIKKLLGTDLESADDRMKYMIACMLLHL
ncbi:MAG TPA: PucR family transcriptional regulator [Lachnospiraceae bacterium]|nr:PucR family transcriptional regulator [Lachnospiraceae bacterium]